MIVSCVTFDVVDRNQEYVQSLHNPIPCYKVDIHYEFSTIFEYNPTILMIMKVCVRDNKMRFIQHIYCICKNVNNAVSVSTYQMENMSTISKSNR